jgi:hypothetical protein
MKSVVGTSRIYPEAPECQVGYLGQHLLSRVRLRASLTLIAFVLGVILPPVLFSKSATEVATQMNELMDGHPMPALSELAYRVQPLWIGISDWAQSPFNWGIAAAIIAAIFYLPGAPMRPVLFRLAFLNSAPILKLNLSVAASTIADALRRGEEMPDALNQAYEATPYPAMAERLQEWRQDMLKEEPLRRGGHRVDEVMAPLRGLIADADASHKTVDALDGLAEASWSRKDLASNPVAPNLMVIIAIFSSGGLIWAAVLPLIQLIDALGA